MAISTSNYGTYPVGAEFCTNAPWNEEEPEIITLKVKAWERAINKRTGNEVEREFTCKVEVSEYYEEEDIIEAIKENVRLLSDRNYMVLDDIGINDAWRV